LSFSLANKQLTTKNLLAAAVTLAFIIVITLSQKQTKEN